MQERSGVKVRSFVKLVKGGSSKLSAPRDNVRFVPRKNVRLTVAKLGGGRPMTTTDDPSRTGPFGDLAQSAEEADQEKAGRPGVRDHRPPSPASAEEAEQRGGQSRHSR